MNREYRIQFCEKCQLREFSREKGLVCSLTKEHATFDKTCPDFVEDEKAAAEQAMKRAEMAEIEEEENSGFTILGMSGVTGGIVAIVGSVVWFVAGWMAGYIYFYPPVLFIIGIVMVAKGAAGGGGNNKAFPRR